MFRAAVAIQVGNPPGIRWSFWTRDQNSHSLSIRSPGLLPAINDALIAPIDVPITQSGCNSGLVQRLVDADLIGAEGPAALQDEHGLAELCDFVCEGLHAHFLSSRWERSGGGVGRPISPVMSRALRW